MELCAQYTWWHIALGALMVGAVSVSVADLAMTIYRWWFGQKGDK
jgi:hypothetical protein